MPWTASAGPTRVLAALIVLAVLGALVAATQGLGGMLLLALAACLVGFVLARDVERIPAAFLFLLFLNAPTVAVRFHGVPVAVAAALPLVLGAPIARHVLLRREPVIVPPTFVLLLAFVVIQFLGALLSTHPEEALLNLVESVTEGILLFAAIVNAVRTPRALRSVVWALVAAGALMGGLALFQELTKTYDQNYWGFAQPSNAAFGTGEETVAGEVLQPRLGGPLGHQNRFAQIMGVLLPLALFQAVQARRRSLRWSAFAAFVLIGIGLSLAFSRGAAVGLAVAFLAALAFGQLRARHLGLVAVAVALTAIAVPEYAIRLATLGEVTGAIGSEGGPGLRNAGGAIRGRLTEMSAAVFMFLDHPVLGVGPGMYREHYQEYAEILGDKVRQGSRQPHSLYLGLAAEHGLLGLGAFGGIALFTLRDLGRARRRCRRRDPKTAHIASSLQVAVLSYLATAVFLHLAFVRYFWALMALAAAVGHALRDERRGRVLEGRLELTTSPEPRPRGSAPTVLEAAGG
jgi:O-antigen ligase